MFVFLVAAVMLVTRDAPARTRAEPRIYDENSFAAVAPLPRSAHWAERLDPIEIAAVGARDRASVRLYTTDGEVDDGARADFERIASNGAQPHVLAVRLEQLVMKAAYHFDGASVAVVSGWRAHAGRHGTGDALDFKLEKIRASQLAAYLRGLGRVGVGVYTHPHTQFVHLDVRDQSYYWIDGSPPGIKWREAPLHDPHAKDRDASWTREMDLPL